MLESTEALVFVEVKIGAMPSAGTRSDPERNQLTRNLDIGFARAAREKTQFALVYVTPDEAIPDIVSRITERPPVFPGSPDVDPRQIASCLHWSSWAAIADSVAKAYEAGALSDVAQHFALDLLAYVAKKGLWRNTLPDLPPFYEDKLYRPLQRNGSPYVPYGRRERELYQGWCQKPWNEEDLRRYLTGLRLEDKALLRILADAGGGLQQHAIFERLPFLRGRSGRSLGALKSHVNAGCKALDCAPLLAQGLGTGDFRIHEINQALGLLRTVVIEEAKAFVIPWHLLQRPAPDTARRHEGATTAGRISSPGKTKAWYVLEGDSGTLIACSCRFYSLESGSFIGKSRADGSFRTAYEAVISDGLEFRPPNQPKLVTTETQGLPTVIVSAAKAARERGERLL